jgi:mono/diheme cytochrome c family protein
MVSALVVMGGFEWTREAARRPYVINEVMYSNSIMKKDVGALNDEGFLRTALWVQTKEVSEDNLAVAGEEIFINQCYACHTVDGINNGIVQATSTMSYPALVSYIKKIHEVRYFMPPFVGTEQEARALAVYIAGGLHGKDVQEPQQGAGSVAKGPALFEENCASCHALEDLSSLQGVAQEEIVAILRTLNEISEEMQPFDGSAEEHEQLAAFLGGHTEKAQQETAIDGKAVFESHCSMCHGVEEMAPMIGSIDRQEIFTMLGRLDELESSMPPFGGTTEEQEALADFLASINQGGK